ncbi:formyl transferase [Fimicolochytrium jonesii]|uniref:formyl transferase n=1 Tax=Fimicolochytrium jonesii TaxID=1396493 RepID=UPI0022FDB9ED|nr:formyl transferase [Fimicolochytrium jonesii]KAI8822949.1 formyl transferase [Fimicolochytrium jonesii]
MSCLAVRPRFLLRSTVSIRPLVVPPFSWIPARPSIQPRFVSQLASQQYNTPTTATVAKTQHSILFFGADEFSIICLKKLWEASEGRGSIAHIEVVTPPESTNKKGFKVPIRKFAKSLGIPIHSAPPKSLKDWNLPTPSGPLPFSLAVVVSFGYFIPRRIIRQFSGGALNVHPSLLPKYRGAAPLQYTILNDDRESGVSIIELDEKKFDVGRIVKQSRIDVPPNTFLMDLHDRLGNLGAEDLLTVVEDLETYKANAQIQDDSKASHAPKITKEMAIIDWTRPADEIYRLHRAIGKKIPLHTTFLGRRIQLLEIIDPSSNPPATHNTANSAPGTLHFNPSHSVLFVACGSPTSSGTSYLPVRTVKMQDKQAVKIDAFVNGYQLKGKEGVMFGAA